MNPQTRRAVLHTIWVIAIEDSYGLPLTRTAGSLWPRIPDLLHAIETWSVHREATTVH
jgi:hypothetical protein